MYAEDDAAETMYSEAYTAETMYSNADTAGTLHVLGIDRLRVRTHFG